MKFEVSETSQAVLFEGAIATELSACSAVNEKFRYRLVSLDFWFPAASTRSKTCFAVSRQKNRNTNRNDTFYIMFCSFSLARVISILRELVNLLKSVLGISLSMIVLYFSLLVQRKVTKEKTPLLRNFLPYQAKTALSAPRRYRSCPSELPAAILNQGKSEFM